MTESKISQSEYIFKGKYFLVLDLSQFDNESAYKKIDELIGEGWYLVNVLITVGRQHAYFHNKRYNN